jgi:hypothetical protein
MSICFNPTFDFTARNVLATLMDLFEDNQEQPIIWCFSSVTELKRAWTQLLQVRVLDQKTISHEKKSPNAKANDVYGLRINGCEIYMHRQSNNLNLNVYNNNGNLAPEIFEFVTGQSYNTIRNAMKSAACVAQKEKSRKITIKTKFNRLETKVDDLDSKVDDLDSKVGNLNVKVSNLERNVKIFEKRLESIEEGEPFELWRTNKGGRDDEMIVVYWVNSVSRSSVLSSKQWANHTMLLLSPFWKCCNAVWVLT